MSTIKVKTGQCKDCPTGKITYLTAGRCKIHYWQYRQSLKQYSLPVRVNKRQNRQELDMWFAEQISIMPRYCEESGEYLNPHAPWGAKTYIAHICAKRNIKSVQTHPLNRMFYSADVHTNFDRATSKEIKLMKTYPLIVARFNQFKHLISQDEYKHLPDYLFELL